MQEVGRSIKNAPILFVLVFRNAARSLPTAQIRVLYNQQMVGPNADHLPKAAKKLESPALGSGAKCTLMRNGRHGCFTQFTSKL